jgi:hypothetical protein
MEKSLVKKLTINLERKTWKISLGEITFAGNKNAGNSLIKKLPIDLCRNEKQKILMSRNYLQVWERRSMETFIFKIT